MNLDKEVKSWKYVKSLQFDRWTVDDAAEYLSGCGEIENALDQLNIKQHYREILDKSELYKYYGQEPSPIEVIDWAKKKKVPICDQLRLAVRDYYSEWIKEYLLHDAWAIKDAVCLIRDINPDILPLSGAQALELKRYLKITESSIREGSLLAIINKTGVNEYFEKTSKQYVKRDEFLCWAYSKNIIIPLVLIEKAKKLIEKSDEIDFSEATANNENASKLHGNKKRFENNRMEIISVAFSLLAHHRDECCNANGYVNVSKICKLVELNAERFWPKNKVAPSTNEVMTKLIRQVLKCADIKKIVKPLKK